MCNWFRLRIWVPMVNRLKYAWRWRRRWRESRKARKAGDNMFVELDRILRYRPAEGKVGEVADGLMRDFSQKHKAEIEELTGGQVRRTGPHVAACEHRNGGLT